MGIVRRSLVALALMVAVVLSLFTLPRDASAQAAGPIFWKTRQLTWSTGALTKDFTASITDTGFVTLPADVAWDVIAGQYSGAQGVITLRFSTSTAAANAVTLHYVVQCAAGVVGGAAVYPFADYRNRTAALTNSATNGRNGDFGLVFTGVIQTNSATAPTSELVSPCTLWRMKVQGDPNGAEAALKVFITYPSRVQ